MTLDRRGGAKLPAALFNANARGRAWRMIQLRRVTAVVTCVVVAASFGIGCSQPKSAAERVLGAPVSLEQALTAGSPLRHPTDPNDAIFLKELRAALHAGVKIPSGNTLIKHAYLNGSFPKKFHGFALIVHQPRLNRFKSVSTKRAEWEDIRIAVNAAAIHPRIRKYSLNDPLAARLQIDFILNAPEQMKNGLAGVSPVGFGARRFEMGVDGLQIKTADKTVYYLPGEAFADSAMGLSQLSQVLFKSFGREQIKTAEFARFKTESYVSWNDRWLRLYRGYPAVGPLTKGVIEKTAIFGTDYLVRTQRNDGRFLYYYDAKLDSFVDHEHPKRDPVKDPYYNELRHVGGTLLLLFDYAHTKNPVKLQAARKGIDWMKSIYVTYTLPDGSEAAYPFYNKKSKLGGSGLALCLLSEYKRLTGDSSHDEDAHRLARHVLSQIQPSGEFFYYNIYLEKPINTAEQNARYFSFYYPGEALMGLSTYYKTLAPKEAKPEIAKKIHMAMEFLVVERPKRYARLYTKLPSDSWLMQAVNDLWDSPELRNESWNRMVFEDAETMVKMMYRAEDAMYPDYVGSFYYNYGDYPYADGARDEGLMAALELAVKAQNQPRAKRYYGALKEAAWAALHLVNTPEAMYAVPNLELAVGGIRFKHTRQWFRVDTIQHVAAFYFKFLPYLRENQD